MQNSRLARAGFRVLLVLLALISSAAGWAALAPFAEDSREQVYVIAKGTWARRMAGENIDILPSELRMHLGVKDVLVIKNDDDVPQIVGPVLLMPGQIFRFPFRSVTKVQFACTLHTSGQLTIVVEPTPGAGWDRLLWRVESLLTSELQLS